MRRRTWIVASLAVAALGIGCVIVTGSTDGYRGPCSTANDCNSDQVCCVNVDLAAVTVSTPKCQDTCGFPNVQLCGMRNHGECRSGACTLQSCAFDAGSIPLVAACGVIDPGSCVVIDASSGDAAADAPSDAGSDAPADSPTDAPPDSPADAGGE